MKLQELAAANPTKQIAKVFESYFGGRIAFDRLTRPQAQKLLNRVRGLVTEHRRQPEFHSSEHNPSYLKLVMMEQALTKRIAEQMPVPPGGTAPAGAMAMPADPAKAAALQTAQVAQKKKEIQDQIKQKQEELRTLQQQLTNPMVAVAENQRSLRRRLKESEVQQAQVVLASQDMVDQVQKMSEQVSAMQFKDLPALVDQIKNEVGVDQASQFNGDASAALAGLLQNLGGAKQALEAALGVVTGQAPQVPGAELAGAEVGADLEAGLPADTDDELDALAADAELDAAGAPGASLGRGRR
jgi:hypothetical protein